MKGRGGRNRERRTVALLTNGLTMNAARDLKGSGRWCPGGDDCE